MVKPIRLTDTMRLAPDQDPFTKLVPFVITEKLSIYQVFSNNKYHTLRNTFLSNASFLLTTMQIGKERCSPSQRTACD
jgi:hypothetical protein